MVVGSVLGLVECVIVVSVVAVVDDVVDCINSPLPDAS